MRTILITGAAGKTGQAIIKALVARRQPVRALVRRDEQIQIVKLLGAKEVIAGDMRDTATLKEATQGASAVYHICPNVNPDEIQIGKTVIAAADEADVDRFVFHSVLHPQTEAMTHHWNKLRVEEMLFESGLSYTILQPASYMQNVLGGWQAVLEHGVYAVPYSVETRMSMVDLEDVAQAAAVVLTEPDHLGATYELAGPEVLTQRQIADVLSKKLERPVRAEQVGIEHWTRQAQASGMGQYQIETLIRMFRYYDHNGFWGNPNVLSQLIRHHLTRFETFVERIMQERNSRH